MKMTSLVLLTVLWLAGCASGGQAPASLAKTDEIGRAAVQFAQCMRDHGYSVADPTFDQDGLPVYGGDLRGAAKDAAFDANRRTCAEPLTAAYQAAGVTSKKETKPEDLLGFTRCMREHGIDIPDPNPDGMLDLPKNMYTSPAWEPAKQACQSLLPESWRSILSPPTGGDLKHPGGGGK
jgi:hypothetical protein